MEANRASRAKEYSAKSVEEALDAAARELKTPVSQLEYEVVEDSTRTILGLVRRGEVVVRIWPKSAAVKPQPAAVKAAPEQPFAAEPEEVLAPAPEQPSEPAEEEAEPSEAEAEETPEQDSDALKHNPPELLNTARDMVATLIDKMGILAAVEVTDRGGELDSATGEVSPVVLNIVGDDLGMLIGRRGDTLRDLQFVVRLLVSRKLGVWPNLVLDVEGYKARRVESLRALAQRMADQARETGRPVILEPMPAYERRIIHLTLRDDPDVYTESTGTDEHRKVQILLK
jgi:spoIIIJ-associated protein